jgi:AcrR family transcriptional regulator
MSEEVKDRRVQKTRQQLKDALIKLILEKGFEAVTVQELLDRSNVGRSTFYLHFDNKYELLHSCFEDFGKLLEQHNAGIRNSKKYSGHLSQSNFTSSLFRLVEQNHELFKALLGKEGLTMFQHPLQDYIHTYMINALKKSLSNKNIPSLNLEMLAQYITSAFIGTIQWWLNNNMPCSAEEADKSFLQFTRQDISFFEKA